MLQYLVILLDDTSVAYCHADNPLKERYLMPIEVLKKLFLGHERKFDDSIRLSRL